MDEQRYVQECFIYKQAFLCAEAAALPSERDAIIIQMGRTFSDSLSLKAFMVLHLFVHTKSSRNSCVKKEAGCTECKHLDYFNTEEKVYI